MSDGVDRFLAGALLCATLIAPAAAQEQFNAVPQSNTQGSPNSSRPTGTQGVTGNPFCAPPHGSIGGKDFTPLNWSCPTVQQPYTPQKTSVARPGPHVPAGVANPCQPGGPGGYNFLDNPVGTRLPAGCVRPSAGNGASKTIAKTDGRYDPAGNRPASSAPPGSYLQPDGKPGDYLQSDGTPGSYLQSESRQDNYPQPDGTPGSYLQSEGKPGDYLQPDGTPGSYLGATSGAGSQTRTNTNQNGANATAQSQNNGAKNQAASHMPGTEQH